MNKSTLLSIIVGLILGLLFINTVFSSDVTINVTNLHNSNKTYYINLTELANKTVIINIYNITNSKVNISGTVYSTNLSESRIYINIGNVSNSTIVLNSLLDIYGFNTSYTIKNTKLVISNDNFSSGVTINLYNNTVYVTSCNIMYNDIIHANSIILENIGDFLEVGSGLHRISYQCTRKIDQTRLVSNLTLIHNVNNGYDHIIVDSNYTFVDSSTTGLIVNVSDLEVYNSTIDVKGYASNAVILHTTLRDNNILRGSNGLTVRYITPELYPSLNIIGYKDIVVQNVSSEYYYINISVYNVTGNVTVTNVSDFSAGLWIFGSNVNLTVSGELRESIINSIVEGNVTRAYLENSKLVVNKYSFALAVELYNSTLVIATSNIISDTIGIFVAQYGKVILNRINYNNLVYLEFDSNSSTLDLVVNKSNVNEININVNHHSNDVINAYINESNLTGSESLSIFNGLNMNASIVLDSSYINVIDYSSINNSNITLTQIRNSYVTIIYISSSINVKFRSDISTIGSLYLGGTRNSLILKAVINYLSISGEENSIILNSIVGEIDLGGEENNLISNFPIGDISLIEGFDNTVILNCTVNRIDLGGTNNIVRVVKPQTQCLSVYIHNPVTSYVYVYNSYVDLINSSNGQNITDLDVAKSYIPSLPDNDYMCNGTPWNTSINMTIINSPGTYNVSSNSLVVINTSSVTLVGKNGYINNTRIIVIKPNSLVKVENSKLRNVSIYDRTLSSSIMLSNVSGSIMLYNVSGNISSSRASIHLYSSRIIIQNSTVSIEETVNSTLIINNSKVVKFVLGNSSGAEIYNSVINTSNVNVHNNSKYIWIQNCTDEQGNKYEPWDHIRIRGFDQIRARCYISNLYLNKEIRFYTHGKLTDIKFYSPYVLVCQVGRTVYMLMINKTMINNVTYLPLNLSYITINNALPHGYIEVCIRNGTVNYNNNTVVNGSGCYKIPFIDVNKTYTFHYSMFDNLTPVVIYGVYPPGTYLREYRISYNNNTVNVTVYSPSLQVVVTIYPITKKGHCLLVITNSNYTITVNNNTVTVHRPYECVPLHNGTNKIHFPRQEGDSIYFGIYYWNGIQYFPGNGLIVYDTNETIKVDNKTPEVAGVAFISNPVVVSEVPIGVIMNNYTAYNLITPKGHKEKIWSKRFVEVPDEYNFSFKSLVNPIINQYICWHPLIEPRAIYCGISQFFGYYINNTLKYYLSPNLSWMLIKKYYPWYYKPSRGKIVSNPIFMTSDVPVEYDVGVRTRINVSANITYYISYIGYYNRRVCLYLYAYIYNITISRIPLIYGLFIVHCFNININNTLIFIGFDFSPLLESKREIIANIWYQNFNTLNTSYRRVVIPLVSYSMIVSDTKETNDASTIYSADKNYELSMVGLKIPRRYLLRMFYHFNVTRGDYIKQMKEFDVTIPVPVSNRHDSVYQLILTPDMLLNKTILQLNVSNFKLILDKEDPLSRTLKVSLTYHYPDGSVINDVLPEFSIINRSFIKFNNSRPTVINIAYFKPVQHIIPELDIDAWILTTDGKIQEYRCVLRNVNLTKGSRTVVLDKDCSKVAEYTNPAYVTNLTSLLFGIVKVVLKTKSGKLLSGYVQLNGLKNFVNGILSLPVFGNVTVTLPNRISGYKLTKIVVNKIDPKSVKLSVTNGVYEVIGYYSSSAKKGLVTKVQIIKLTSTYELLKIIGSILLLIGILLLVTGTIMERYGVRH